MAEKLVTADRGNTMNAVADKKKKPGRPATGRKPTTVVFARVKPALGAVLDAYIDSVAPRTTMTAVVELALEKYLSELGLWPPRKS